MQRSRSIRAIRWYGKGPRFCSALKQIPVCPRPIQARSNAERRFYSGALFVRRMGGAMWFQKLRVTGTEFTTCRST